MIVQMVVLFGIISVIYKPLTHLQKIPSAVIDTAIVTVTNPVDENGNDILTPNKITQADANPNSYYRELRMLKVLSANQGEVVAAIDAMDPANGESCRARIITSRCRLSGAISISLAGLCWTIPFRDSAISISCG